jgi:hypothetical protein
MKSKLRAAYHMLMIMAALDGYQTCEGKLITSYMVRGGKKYGEDVDTVLDEEHTPVSSIQLDQYVDHFLECAKYYLQFSQEAERWDLVSTLYSVGTAYGDSLDERQYQTLLMTAEVFQMDITPLLVTDGANI